MTLRRFPVSYEVVLGSYANTKVSVLLGSAVVAETDAAALLDCDDMRRFWVSWKDGALTVRAQRVTWCDTWVAGQRAILKRGCLRLQTVSEYSRCKLHCRKAIPFPLQS